MFERVLNTSLIQYTYSYWEVYLKQQWVKREELKSINSVKYAAYVQVFAGINIRNNFVINTV